MRRGNVSGTRSWAVMIAVVISSAATLILIPAMAVALDRPVGQAIQFGIGSSFTLRQFDGATISYLHYRDHDRAWRASLDLNLNYEDADARLNFWNGQEGADTSHDEATWRSSAGAVFECLWYRGEAISTYFGGGPRVSFASQHNEYWDFYLDEGWRKHVYEDNDFGAGVRGSLGIQWVATRWLTIHAEYNAQALYHRKVSKRLSENTGTGVHDNETVVSNGLSLDSLGARFGLSVYF